MRFLYSNNSSVPPSKTELSMSHITFNVKFLREKLGGLSRWLEVLTACNIIFWMIELLCSTLPHVFYSGASGVLFSVACEYSTTSYGTGVGLFYTLLGRVITPVPGASLYTLGYSVAVVMAPVAIVVDVVIVKKYTSSSKASIYPPLCGRYPHNAFLMSFSYFSCASTGVAV